MDVDFNSLIPTVRRWKHGGTARHIRFNCLRNAYDLPLQSDDFCAKNLGINLVLSGKGTFKDWDGNQYAIEPGSLFFRLPEKPTSQRMLPNYPWLEWYVTIDPRTYNELSEAGLLPLPSKVVHDVPPATFEAFRRLTVTGFQTDTPPVGLLLGLLQWINQVFSMHHYGCENGPAQRLEAAAARMDADICNILSLTEIAAESGLGFETFRKAFVKHFGVSPGQYRIRRRIEQACANLANKSSSVQEIADSLGYSSAFAFSTQFRKYTGRSPRQYRKEKATEYTPVL
jgi:AraC-like DNA-binding protein